MKPENCVCFIETTLGSGSKVVRIGWHIFRLELVNGNQTWLYFLLNAFFPLN